MSHDSAHLFPFSIDKEGPVNTKYYFQIDKEGDHYESVVMGRKLVGQSIKVGDSTQGYLFEKEFEEDEEHEEGLKSASVWKKTNTTINEFILWKKDTPPKADDPRNQALQDWIDLSKAIHEPLPLPKK